MKAAPLIVSIILCKVTIFPPAEIRKMDEEVQLQIMKRDEDVKVVDTSTKEDNDKWIVQRNKKKYNR